MHVNSFEFVHAQYGVISKLALVVSAVICAIYLFRIQTPEQEKAGLTRCFSIMLLC